MPQPPHRVAITADIQNRTGIDDAMIESLVHRFYAFEETAREVCPPPAADYFMDRARRIASSFELGIASRNKVLLARGERYVNDALDVALES